MNDPGTGLAIGVLAFAALMPVVCILLWRRLRAQRLRTTEALEQVEAAKQEALGQIESIKQEADSQVENVRSEAEKAATEVRERFGSVMDVDAELRRVESDLSKARQELQTAHAKHRKEAGELGAEKRTLQNAVDELKSTLRDLEEVAEIQSFGFYKAKYNFGSSVEYKEALDRKRAQQKQDIKDKTATYCGVDWAVDGDRRRGDKQVRDFTKLMLRAFNGECDAAMSRVKYNNFHTMEKRITKAFEAINKLGSVFQIRIQQHYLVLKIDEMHLLHEFQEKVQEEKEEQRIIKEQMREEERAAKEFEKARREAEREERRYAEALRKAQEQVAEAQGAKHDKLMAKIAELEGKLSEAEENTRAISQAQLTRMGHVYIISNIGAFGEGVYKIGMTRRLTPEDRVRELSSASVPFPYDVHAMIFSEDAPALEKALHQIFKNRRLNMINGRKEFFCVSLAEIASEARKMGAEVKVIRFPEAKEYRLSVAAAEQSRHEGLDVDAVEVALKRGVSVETLTTLPPSIQGLLAQGEEAKPSAPAVA